MKTSTVMRSSSWVVGSCELHNAVGAQVAVLQLCIYARAKKHSCRYQPSFQAPDIASLASLVRSEHFLQLYDQIDHILSWAWAWCDMIYGLGSGSLSCADSAPLWY